MMATNGQIIAKQQNRKTINAIILEDELPGLEALQSALAKYCPHVNVVGIGATVAEGVKFINNPKIKVDVAFLDIKLDDGMAFDLFNYIEKVEFDVIFVTAWDEYLQQACNYYSIGFLLKPFEPEALMKAVERAEARISETTDTGIAENYNQSLEFLIHQVRDGSGNGRFPIPTTKGYYFVKLNDVIRLEGDDNYTKIFIKGEDAPMMASRTIKNFEEMLTRLNFARIHKRHIINIQNVKQYLKSDQVVEMIDGANLDVSKRRRKDFLKIVKKSPFVYK